MNVWRAIGKAGGKALDIILPPHCLNCQTATADAHQLCSICWPRFHFLQAPLCHCCGQPFPHDDIIENDLLCARCIQRQPKFNHARAVWAYDDISKPLILKLKHSDALSLVPGLSRWLWQIGREFIPHDALIVPVPLHWRRLAWRRYNQAAVLAQRLARLSQTQYLPDALLRKRATPSQGKQTAKRRWTNMRGAFAINKKHATTLKDSSVVLIDDVFTTGATIDACCRMLRRAKVKQIIVLTLAKVV